MSVTTHKESAIKSGYLFRYRKVISVLLKYGFENIVAHMPLAGKISVARFLVPKRHGKSVLSFSRYERIKMVCEELGTTFIRMTFIILRIDLIH